MLNRSVFNVSGVLVSFCFSITTACAQDLAPQIEGALGSLATTFPEGEAAAFTETLAALPEGVTGDTLGHLLYARRHFDKAAWFFGTDALGDLSDPTSLNNFSAMLVQTWADAPDSYPVDWLAAARLASDAATELSPDTAAYHNNLANAARHQGDNDAAVAAATRATELAPEEPLYWTNLARALDAAGDAAGAAAALARAHALDPNGMPVLETTAALPNTAPAYSEAIQPNCNVNFRCQELCPKSIIGGIMSVTCEIENSSAQMACQAGQPYATSYRCAEDFPEYGILIPGLNSGLSIAVPGFSVHVLVDGAGNVDVRVEAGASIGPVTGYLRGDGHFSPDGGASYDNLGGGVRINILPKSPANKLASDLGHPPAHIEAESVDGQPVGINVEGYNAGVLSY